MFLSVPDRKREKRSPSHTESYNDLLGVVSHELRSPLSGIQGWAQVLERQLPETAPAVCRRALRGIHNGVAQQARLIQDLLDVTDAMNGRLELAHEPFQVTPAIDAAVDSVRETADAKHIAIEVSGQAGVCIEGDPLRFRQILWHLLANAVKFTPADGRIEVRLGASDRSVDIVVRDNGIGIQADVLPQLFAPFAGLDRSTSRRHGGLGLGLALVRGLIELHGGAVRAESEGLDQGTAFFLSFPRHRTDDTAIRPVPASSPRAVSLQGIRVLLIDDQADVRDSLCLSLQQQGATIAVVSSGEKALQFLRAHRGDASPQVLVCDIAMPGEDGNEVLRHIRHWWRESNAGRADMPAIALTALTREDDRARTRVAGFQLHLVKPVNAGELAAAIVALVGRSAA